MRHLLVMLATGFVSACAAYGSVSTARISDDTIVTSSRSASVGTDGVSTRSERGEIRY